MRVLLSFGTSAGGVGRHVAALARGLAEDGHRVLVAAPPLEVSRFGVGDIPGVEVTPLAVRDRPDPRTDLPAVTRLRRLAARADVVHAHGIRLGGLAAVALPRRTPLVVTLHNAAPSGGATAVVYAVLERLVARRAEVVLGVSHDLVARMDALGARRTGAAVVPAPPRPAVTTSTAAVRAGLGLRDGTHLVVSVGRLTAQKDFGTLLAATARLAGLDVLVAIAGEGPDREPLQRAIDARDLPVRLLGARSDVPDLLAAAGVVVSSARWEGQPLWLQEALQVGAPLVVTDAGGTVETIDGAAVIVPVGDAQILANGIRAVLTDPGERAELVRRSEQAARGLPTLDDAVDAAVSSYRDAIRDAR